ncbi:hypothetical protein V1511DRAFT_455937 [Dipodascopsis uninucleata]
MLLQLPSELLLNILLLVDVHDILAISATSKGARVLILQNDPLWRSILRRRFDPISYVNTSDNNFGISTLRENDISVQQHLGRVGQQDQLSLIYKASKGMSIGNTSTGGAVISSSSATAVSSVSSSSAALAPSSYQTSTCDLKVSPALEQLRLRTMLLLRNGLVARVNYASVGYRLRVREQVVSNSIKLLCEHETKNYNIIANSQLFSAIIFDQLLPGTFPSLQLERLPSAAAYTLKPAAYALQQQIDMLRLIFAQRLICCPLHHDTRELQAIVYDSNRFPLFTSLNHGSDAVSTSSRADRSFRPMRLPDSAWVYGDHIFDNDVVPRFEVLLKIIYFFLYYFEHNQVIREGLLPFFNMPCDTSDIDFKHKEYFEFPHDWTGVYSYLTFWDFDLLRRSSTGELPDPLASHPSSQQQEQFQDHHASVLINQNTASTNTNINSNAASPSIKIPPPRDTPKESDTTFFPDHTPKLAKFQDQFDGFQIMETVVPPIKGAVSFEGRGRDRFDYTTHIFLQPLPATYGLPGFARFGMRKEYSRSEGSIDDNDSDEVIWEYNGVYIPGPKIILGRWRDASDNSGAATVEGPFMFFADEL